MGIQTEALVNAFVEAMTFSISLLRFGVFTNFSYAPKVFYTFESKVVCHIEYNIDFFLGIRPNKLVSKSPVSKDLCNINEFSN